MNLKSVKNRLKDETLDLSLCDLKEVPVREIAAVKKATHLDLSSNLLVSLPSTFVSLKHIVKLDLSRNMLTEIPENFGDLTQLKYLDLYANQISRLPLSLSELKNLRWLDLKENPLTPAVASIAGLCSNLSECQACARNIVNYLSRVKLTIEEEKLRRLNAITDTETSNALSKKASKKKKKKSVDKDAKENSDKNGSSVPAEISEIDKNTAESLIAESLTKKQAFSGGNKYRSFLSVIMWLLILGIAFTSIFLTLPLYSEQSKSFVRYLETKTNIPLETFQKNGVDVFRVFMQSVSAWSKSMYNNLLHTDTINLETNANVPVRE